MTQIIALAAFVAVFFVFCIGESLIRKRKPIDDLKAAWDHGHANDLNVLRQCWNSKALQLKAPRSISGVRGGL